MAEAPATPPPHRQLRGRKAHNRGVAAERIACRALEAEGWVILGQRLRTAAGEIDMVAQKGDLVAIIEVKGRPTLSEAAYAVSERQRRRLLLSAEILFGENPAWAAVCMRFDVILVDAAGNTRRIQDAFRAETSAW